MTTKHLFLSMALCASLNLANASSSSGSSANNSPSFEYEAQVFKRFAASNLDESLPSLAQLYQDAKTRKTHIDGLFTYLDTHKLTPQTTPLFEGLIAFGNRLRKRSRIAQVLPDDIMALSILKSDYTLERDLMTYFTRALEHMATTPATQAQMEELYAQAAFTVRLNLQSLGDRIFDYLSENYPKCFYCNTDAGGTDKNVNLNILTELEPDLDEEDRALTTFTRNMSTGRKKLYDIDTVEIAREARPLFKIPNISSASVVFDLNSLSFYLNLERALLAACDTLRFDAHKLGFDHKNPHLNTERYALAAFMEYHKKGTISQASSRAFSERELSNLRSTKDRLLSLMVKDEPTQALNTMLGRLGIIPAAPAPKETPWAEQSQKPAPKKGKASGKKKANKQKGKSKDTRKKGALSPTKKAEVAPAPAPNVLLLSQEEWDIDEPPVTPLNAEQTDSSSDEDEVDHQGASAPRSYLSALASSSSQSSTHVARQIPHLDDYLFKRNVAWTQHINRATYTFNGQRFVMEGAVFPREQLLRVKELTGHKPGQAKLPNLASAHLRFHYTVNGVDKSYDFVPQDLYLSGGNRFANDSTYRKNAHVHNAYHDILSHAERAASRKEGIDTRWERITHTATHALDTHVAKGPWSINCADSEGILLLDVTKRLPRYLGQLAALEGAPLHIHGAVLGVSTYRDPCWRCRNLLQGWQWGLENALTVASEQNALPITVTKNLPTLVYGFGEIKPDSHDFFPPHVTNEETVLTSATKQQDPGSTHKLRLVSMRP